MLRYETAAMKELRQQLKRDAVADVDIDTFKRCLILLERHGFSLIRNTTHV